MSEQFSFMFNIIPIDDLPLIRITNATGRSVNLNSFQIPQFESLTRKTNYLLTTYFTVCVSSALNWSVCSDKERNPEAINISSVPKRSSRGCLFTVALQEAIPPKGILFSYSKKGLTFPESCDMASTASLSSIITN